VTDETGGALVGFGTWRHRLSSGPNLAIGIEWLGVARDYQGKRLQDGSSIAGAIFDTLEARARTHDASTPDMPLVLEVDVDNGHAQSVYEHWGFVFLEVVGTGPRRYNRLIRGASA
jgi:GNAT superfamily N-acetyltransferase